MNASTMNKLYVAQGEPPQDPTGVETLPVTPQAGSSLRLSSFNKVISHHLYTRFSVFFFFFSEPLKAHFQVPTQFAPFSLALCSSANHPQIVCIAFDQQQLPFLATDKHHFSIYWCKKKARLAQYFSSPRFVSTKIRRPPQ